MNYFRQHWYQIGLILGAILSAVLLIDHQDISSFRILLSISLVSLFIHQFEEYQFPGYFPRMLNTALFKSNQPENFPLNTNTALIINVFIGWLLYILAIIFAQSAVWIAIASIMISIGNIVGHTFLFNIKGRTLYNPGLASSILLFLPLAVYFFIFLGQHHLIHPATLVVGIMLGLIVNYLGVVKLISILGNRQSPYIFSPYR